MNSSDQTRHPPTQFPKNRIGGCPYILIKLMTRDIIPHPSAIRHLSSIIPQPSDIFLPSDFFLLTSLPPPLGNKQVRTELPEQREQTKLVWSLPSRVGIRRSQLPEQREQTKLVWSLPSRVGIRRSQLPDGLQKPLHHALGFAAWLVQEP